MHELLQHTVLDEHVAAGGEALTVDIGGGVGLRVRRVVDQRDDGAATLSPSRSRNSDRPLTTASPLSVDEIDPEELCGDERVEHHRQAAARRLRRAEQSGGPIDGLAGGPVEIELVG